MFSSMYNHSFPYAHFWILPPLPEPSQVAQITLPALTNLDFPTLPPLQVKSEIPVVQPDDSSKNLASEKTFEPVQAGKVKKPKSRRPISAEDYSYGTHEVCVPRIAKRPWTAEED
jgi:hypothetical protein